MPLKQRFLGLTVCLALIAGSFWLGWHQGRRQTEKLRLRAGLLVNVGLYDRLQSNNVKGAMSWLGLLLAGQLDSYRELYSPEAFKHDKFLERANKIVDEQKTNWITITGP